MNYSTLQEAYNIDTFEKKPKPSHKSRNPNGGSGGTNTPSPSSSSSNTSPAFVESSKLALSSCSPLQAPTYNIPISNDCKREHEAAMNVYTSANNNLSNMMNTIPSSVSGVSGVSDGFANFDNSANAANAANAANTANPISSFNANINNSQPLPPSQQQQSSSSALLPAQNQFQQGNNQFQPAQNLFNGLKGSNNVMPYYDEDLEQYFNISNLNDEVKYNPNDNSKINPYMPNNNKQSYTNNDTAEYTNSNTSIKNGNNLLNNSSYNLTTEEKKSAEEAIAYLKSIEDKINGSNGIASGYNRNTVADPVIPAVNTGPVGFKTPAPVKDAKDIKDAKDAKDAKTGGADNYIYNAIFNISILLVIGIAVILLCDQIVELSINIGMKRTINILEPFIRAHAAAQAAAAQAAAAQAAAAQQMN